MAILTWEDEPIEVEISIKESNYDRQRKDKG